MNRLLLHQRLDHNVWIKLCGMLTPEDIVAAERAGADAIGWIFVPGTRRYRSPSEAAAMLSATETNLQKVGVFANADLDEVAKAVALLGLDYVQLHGDEDEQYILELNKRTPCPVIKTLRLGSRSDFYTLTNEYAGLRNIVAYLLEPQLEGMLGGGGKTFPWEWIDHTLIDRPFIVAGGLNPENVAEAIRTTQPNGVDVSSGVETNGRKDPLKMLQFVQAARTARAKPDTSWRERIE